MHLLKPWMFLCAYMQNMHVKYKYVMIYWGQLIEAHIAERVNDKWCTVSQQKERCICEQRCLHAIYVLLLLCSCKPYVRTICIVYMFEHAIVLFYSTTTIFANIIHTYNSSFPQNSCTRTRLHTNTIKHISFIWIIQRKLCHAFSWGVCVRPWKRCYCIYCLMSLQPGSDPILWVAHVPSTCSQIHGSNNWA